MRTLNLAAAAVALLPLFFPSRGALPEPTVDLPWPEAFRAMQSLPVSDFEARFAESAGARVGRFQNGGEEFLLRWLSGPNRRIHPPEHCFRGSGWNVQSKPGRSDPLPGQAHAIQWSCSEAFRDVRRLEVCQVIVDAQGRSWSDTGSWWWAAQLQKLPGPWLGVVRMRSELPERE